MGSAGKVERIQAGAVVLYRWKCHNCGREQLAGEAICRDCGRAVSGEDSDERVICGAKRKIIGKAERKEILSRQMNRCHWCARPFGSQYFDGKRKNMRSLRIHWDHVIPYSYSQDNSVGNFVAACSVCNHFKSSLIFQDAESLRAYLRDKWMRKIKRAEIEFTDDYLNASGIIDEFIINV